MNKRTKDIVGELIRTDQTLTISDLSTHFGVSERTIRNDLNNINDWLGQNGLSLIKLGSNGRIEYRPEIEEVQKFVLENDFYSYKLSKEERKLIMAAILISSSEYTTLAKIADILFVSRVTVINDLDDVKRFISQEKLKVISHSNKGLRVEGEESRKRRMLLLMNRPQREFGQMDFAGNTLNRLMGIEGEEQEIIRKIINEQEHANNSFMTDDSFHELTLYLSILLKRVRQGEFVEKQDISYNLRYPMAAGILKYLCQYCGVTVTEDEVQYLSMVLSGLRYLKKDDFNGDIVKTQLITRQFIEAVSRTLELDFNNDYVFYENLSNHLQSIFESSDLSFKENPVLRQILDKNKQIEYAVDENRAIVEKYIRRPLSPVELTYIAIHICAAIERKKNKEVAFHVILVCHGGIGTSQLLLERLKKHFNFQIVDIMSAHEVGRIRKGQADMVISTVRLSDCEIDNVVVTPSLDDTDYLKVGHLIDDLRSRKNLPPRLEKKKITAVCFDNGMVGGELPYIGIDNHKTGYQLAQELAEQLDHKGQVGIVAGDLKQKGHRERVEGFEEYMKSEPEMTLKFVESGYANLQMSEQKVRDLMGQYPQIRGIMATSAVTAMGLVDELKDTDIKIVAVDEQEDSLKAVENGQILALAAQSGYEIGYETIHYIQNLRNGKHLKKKYYLNAEILTQDNVKEYRKKDESQKYKK